MKPGRFILFVILISTGILKAQTDFRPGYIINLTGDTLHGQIDYRGDKLMSSICKFKNDDHKIIEYTPDDIIAYRFIDSKYFVSREITHKKVFLEHLIKGQVNIYYLRDKKGDHYYIDRKDLGLTEIPYQKEFKTIDGKNYSIESTWHIDILSLYMQDAPEFQSRIQSIKKPEHQNLIKLAEDYHNYVCEDELCIIYVKRQPLIKVNVEAVAGVINFENVLDLNDKFYFHSGIIAHIWMPRTNENIYLKTGILYSQLEYTYGEKYNYLYFPLHIGYLAPNTFRVRPSLSIGILSPSYSAGVSLKITKQINIGIQSWANFYHRNLQWIPDKLFNYSILGNIYIEL